VRSLKDGTLRAELSSCNPQSNDNNNIIFPLYETPLFFTAALHSVLGSDSLRLYLKASKYKIQSQSSHHNETTAGIKKSP